MVKATLTLIAIAGVGIAAALYMAKSLIPKPELPENLKNAVNDALKASEQFTRDTAKVAEMASRPNQTLADYKEAEDAIEESRERAERKGEVHIVTVASPIPGGTDIEMRASGGKVLETPTETFVKVAESTPVVGSVAGPVAEFVVGPFR